MDSSKKVKLDIFIPLNACSCAYSHFMDNVMKSIDPFKSKIDFQIKSTDSQEADQLNLLQMAVVIRNYPGSENPIIITDLEKIEQYLSKL